MTIRKTLLTALLTLATTCWLAAVMAQDKKKKEEEENAPAKKPPAAKPADTPKPADTTKPAEQKKEGEEEEEARPKRPGGIGGRVSLADEAKRAPHPKIKEILEKLTLQCDIVTGVSGAIWEVEPIKKRFETSQQTPVAIKIIKDGTERTLPRDQITSVSHYEFRLQKAAEEVQNSRLDQPDPTGKAAVPRSKLLRLAEMLYSEGLRFHADAKERRLRTDGWLGLEDKFKQDLQQVQIAQLRALTGESDWKEGEALAAYLRFDLKYPPTRDLMEAIEAHYLALAQAHIAKNEHPAARRKLEFYQKKYANAVSSSVEHIHKQLQEKATQYLREGKELADKGDASGAFARLQIAEDTWPQLAGLQELRARTLKAFPVLRVGVKQLPTQISPTTAVSDVDHAACQLVFEQLFKLRSGPSARDGYECPLDIEVRSTQQGGWDLVLPQDIKWSDGKPFTSDDILRSKEIYTDGRSPYYNPLAKEILKIQSEDDYHLSVTLQRGHIDPLSMLTFPLLPAHRLARDRSPRDPAFGKNPIGTGPYVFKGIDSEGKEAIFVANPHYKRPHAPDGPAIKEIRLVHFPDFAQAKQALASGVVQILFGFPSKEFDELEVTGQVELLTPTQPRDGDRGALTNPRLWVLIPNHRKTESLANGDLRKAVSMLINRDDILKKFRGKRNEHQVLNGPFPLGSWAYNEAYLPDKAPPFKPQAAKGSLHVAQQKLGRIPPLSLMCSAEDPEAAEACREISIHLAKEGVAINVQPVPAGQIVAELAKDRPTFDLIYWHIDFDNEVLDLWPYYDPDGMMGNGRNFMGIPRDNEIEGKFRKLQTRRDFTIVKAEMQLLHHLLIEQKMTLIPLWQLDRHVAVRNKSLRVTRIHPLWLFDDVEQWRLVFGD